MFSNVYWSPDYKSGIDSLNRQSKLSLGQIHDLRHLVFSSMSYYYANGEYLQKLAADMTESCFSRDWDKTSESEITVNTPVNLYTKNLINEANTLKSLASAIDREVLETLNDFIKAHEPYIRQGLNHLYELADEYGDTFKEIDNIKREYNDYKRLQEDSVKKQQDVENISDTSIIVTDESDSKVEVIESENDDVPSIDSDQEGEFAFPIFLGTSKVNSQSELSAFLRDAQTVIETSKRTIPLLGHKPDIFSSDNLCEFLIQRRPFKLNPTRSNLEKFGQSLFDLKLAMASSLIPKKFKSEGVWLEWTDLAFYIANYSETKPESTHSTPRSSAISSPKPITKSANVLGINHGRLNDMFKTMKISLLNTNYETKLDSLETEYEEKYHKLHELRYLLDKDIIYLTQRLETFEKLKFKLIYEWLVKLSQLVYKNQSASTTRLNEFTTTFVETCGNADINKDLHRLITKFSTGIYTPSSVMPGIDNYSSANNNFHNLKLEFNLYKDITLQLKVSETSEGSELLSIVSLPYFVNKMLTLIETKRQLDGETKPWELPLNHNTYWHLKEKVIRVINGYDPQVTIDNESTIQQHIIERVVDDCFQAETVTTLVNFFKYWLLEISDSLIPCLVYDSLIGIYQKQGTTQDVFKQLSAIPRSNLSSLIFLVEHICVEYELAEIPSFGINDEFPGELKPKDDLVALEQVSQKLNNMEMVVSVPFIHLILRPSILKINQGFRPPIEIYLKLLTDLLSIDLRCDLLNHLVNYEKSIIKKNEAKKLGLKRYASPLRKDVEVLSPRPISTPEGFSLRPFRTKVTPNPSPVGSPKYR